MQLGKTYHWLPAERNPFSPLAAFDEDLSTFWESDCHNAIAGTLPTYFWQMKHGPTFRPCVMEKRAWVGVAMKEALYEGENKNSGDKNLDMLRSLQDF